MPKTTIACVRHAQGFHNLSTANHILPDPSLTPFGEEQCATLANSFPAHPEITHLVASPLRRTLYTALLSFPEAVARGIKVIALPELQETSDLPCDTGSERAVLEKEFSDKVDLNLVGEGWNSKKGKWSPAASAIESRARDARIWLQNLAEKHQEENTDGRDIHIVVVTHGGYLHYFTEDWNEHEKFVGTGWANTEYRSYKYVGEEGDALVELEESSKRRGVRQLSESEQRNLRESAEKEWSLSGYQTPREMEVEQTQIEVS